MRSCIAVLLAFYASISAFAQGRVTFETTSIEFGQCGVPAGLVCQPVGPPGSSPVVLIAGLFAGSSSNNMTLQTTVVINPVGGTGQPPPTRVILNGLPAGTLVYMQVQIWDSAYAIPQAVPCGGYFGASTVFTMTPGSFPYPSIISGGGSTCPPVPWFVCPKSCPPDSVRLSLVTNPPGLPAGEYIGLTLNGGGGPLVIQHTTNLGPNNAWTTLTNFTQWNQQWVDPDTNALSAVGGFYRIVPCSCPCYGLSATVIPAEIHGAAHQEFTHSK